MAFDLSKLSALLKKDIAKPTRSGVVGVDVGSSAIRVVELHENKGIATLDTYGELQLGPYEGTEIGRTTHLPPAKLTEAFVDILREASASSKDVAIAISYNASFITIVSVPTTDSEQITNMIPVEARKYVPVPLNEISLDWFPVSARSEKNETKILLAAIHNEALKRYDVMVKGASLEKKFTEIEIFSTIRSSVSQKDDTVAIIDFGAGSTKLYITRKGVVGKTHSVLMSGVELTNAIMQAMSVEFAKAEEMKRTSGLFGIPDDPRMQKALISVLERGMHEMQKVIARYEEEEDTKVEKVILSGSGALLNGLPAYTQDMLGRPVTIANPFSKVAYPAFLEDTLKEAGPSFAVAVGAALRALMN